MYTFPILNIMVAQVLYAKQNDINMINKEHWHLYFYRYISIIHSCQVNLICWKSDFYIEYNIAATKSSFAATIGVFVPQCHLNLRESLII